MSLGGRTALVTGATRGVGLAIARHLLRAGARVALVDVDVTSSTRSGSTNGRTPTAAPTASTG